MEYKVGDKVRFRKARCWCVGGGFENAEGIIVGIVHPNEWFQIDQPRGIVVVKIDNITEKVE